MYQVSLKSQACEYFLIYYIYRDSITASQKLSFILYFVYVFQCNETKRTEYII